MGAWILSAYMACAVYTQSRGRLKHKKLTRRITDHANVLAPINCLFYSTSKVPNTPYLSLTQFPELQTLQDNWQIIRDEALALHGASAIRASEKLDDLGFNSFFKTGWKRFYLKWYGSDLGSARQHCPQTLALIKSIPSIKGAMFAMLPPGARLVKHRDPFAGSLRYYLGLSTPQDDRCFIDVDGEKYSWRDGEAVMFDETYIHYAENQTDKDRIILFLDIKRPVKLSLVDAFNNLFSRTVMAATATRNTDGDRVGVLNKAFGGIYQIRKAGKRLKAFNRPLYYTVQYALYAALIYALFF